MGSFYQATTRAFSVGDWVRIGPFYGEVARSDWLSTTLLEVDIEKGTYDYTGKTLTIPNHLLVTHTVQNLNFMRRYVLHSFAIVRDAENINLFEARQFILTKVEEYCAPFQEVAKRYAHIIEKRMGLHLSTLKPSVRITTSDIGKNVFTVALFCPTQEAVNIEQMIYADFMSYWYKQANEASQN
ncbi:MAG: mechanosensitive ion channel family protein, partial [Pseudomonadales bacterium]|nr:mechanosensitive ion channel family protein [Pseudomonadales bacterium]